MTGILVQVRITSSRLPRKALLPLGDRTSIEQVMLALSRVQADIRALVTDPESRGVLEPLARRSGFRVSVGPRDDVLSRYAIAARRYGLSTVIRATGDNPLVSAEVAHLALEKHHQDGNDFTALIDAPLGTGVEVLQAEALFRAEREADEDYDREHVSPYIFSRPDRFRVYRERAPERYLMPDAKVTLDTPEDYELLQRIYRDLFRGEPIPIRELLCWLELCTANRAR
jgi:spore coat polysaccharide biosynthesis protein SpsF